MLHAGGSSVPSLSLDRASAPHLVFDVLRVDVASPGPLAEQTAIKLYSSDEAFSYQVMS